MDDINWGRSLPYGGTLLEKAVQGKTLSFPPTREQLSEPQKFESEVIKSLGVKK